MRWSGAWLFILAFGCNSETRTSDGQVGGGSQGGGASDCPVTLGGEPGPLFEQPTSRVRVYAGTFFTVVDGAVLDGPRRELHTESARSGMCRLLTYDSPALCDPACESPALCVGGVCERFPVPVSVGTLSAELGDARSVDIEPNDVGRYYYGTEDFGFDAVDVVRVSAKGDVASGFELEACLAPPPQPTSEWGELMRVRKPGEDVELAWSNPVSTARVYLRMTTCIGTHGGISPVEVECEGPDVGRLTLPGAYLDALYAQGWGHGECGGNDVLRYHASQAGSAESAVQLRAEALASFWFQPGRGAP